MGEKARIRALAKGNAWVVSKLLRNLAIPRIDGEDTDSPALEHAIGKPTCGCSDVDAAKTRELDRPMGKRMLEFEAAAAHIFKISPKQPNGCPFGNSCTGLINTLLVDKNAACKDKGLGALAGSGVALVYEEFIEANLHER